MVSVSSPMPMVAMALGVQVDDQGAVSLISQAGPQIQGGGGLAGAALLIDNRHYMRHDPAFSPLTIGKYGLLPAMIKKRASGVKEYLGGELVGLWQRIIFFYGTPPA